MFDKPRRRILFSLQSVSFVPNYRIDIGEYIVYTLTPSGVKRMFDRVLCAMSFTIEQVVVGSEIEINIKPEITITTQSIPIVCIRRLLVAGITILSSGYFISFQMTIAFE